MEEAEASDNISTAALRFPRESADVTVVKDVGNPFHLGVAAGEAVRCSLWIKRLHDARRVVFLIISLWAADCLEPQSLLYDMLYILEDEIPCIADDGRDIFPCAVEDRFAEKPGRIAQADDQFGGTLYFRVSSACF